MSDAEKCFAHESPEFGTEPLEDTALAGMIRALLDGHTVIYRAHIKGGTILLNSRHGAHVVENIIEGRVRRPRRSLKRLAVLTAAAVLVVRAFAAAGKNA